MYCCQSFIDICVEVAELQGCTITLLGNLGRGECRFLAAKQLHLSTVPNPRLIAYYHCSVVCVCA